MSRDRELAPGRRSKDTSARPGRRANHPVLALQQAIGNRAVGQVLARKGSRGPTIQLGKLKIEVAGGNIDVWATAPSDKLPDALELTSQKGKHSAELERLSKERTKFESVTLRLAAPNQAGQQLDLGSLAIKISPARVTGYKVDGKTESWQVVGFERVNRHTEKHGVK